MLQGFNQIRCNSPLPYGGPHFSKCHGHPPSPRLRFSHAPQPVRWQGLPILLSEHHPYLATSHFLYQPPSCLHPHTLNLFSTPSQPEGACETLESDRSYYRKSTSLLETNGNGKQGLSSRASDTLNLLQSCEISLQKKHSLRQIPTVSYPYYLWFY